MKDSITSYTITCSRPTNYGAVLQTYSLNTALRKMGVDAKVLDYNPKYYYTRLRGRCLFACFAPSYASLIWSRGAKCSANSLRTTYL